MPDGPVTGQSSTFTTSTTFVIATSSRKTFSSRPRRTRFVFPVYVPYVPVINSIVINNIAIRYPLHASDVLYRVVLNEVHLSRAE